MKEAHATDWKGFPKNISEWIQILYTLTTAQHGSFETEIVVELFKVS